MGMRFTSIQKRIDTKCKMLYNIMKNLIDYGGIEYEATGTNDIARRI